MAIKKLQIARESRILIESIVRENPKFQGNEELMDLFCEAIYKKSYLLLDAIKDKARLKRHLAVICENSVEQILKEKARYIDNQVFEKPKKKTENQTQIVSLKSTPFQEDETLANELERQKLQGIVNLKEEIQRSEKYDSVDILIDPLEFCPQKRVSEKTLSNLIEIIHRLDKKHPSKQYYNIFSYRYFKKLDQMEIAHELKLSQVELSKRYVEMIKLIKEEI